MLAHILLGGAYACISHSICVYYLSVHLTFNVCLLSMAPKMVAATAWKFKLCGSLSCVGFNGKSEFVTETPPAPPSLITFESVSAELPPWHLLGQNAVALTAKMYQR